MSIHSMSLSIMLHELDYQLLVSDFCCIIDKKTWVAMEVLAAETQLEPAAGGTGRICIQLTSTLFYLLYLLCHAYFLSVNLISSRIERF